MQDPKKLMIGIPCYTGFAAAETSNSLLRSQGLYAGIIWVIGSCHIGGARNETVRQFLEGSKDCDKLLFVDTDIIFTPEQLQRIVNHDLPVVAAVYSLRSMTGTASFSPDRDRWPNPDEETGLWRVKRAATGFMAIQRSVFERIANGSEDRHYKRDGLSLFDFFPSGLNERHEFVTDDYGFCDLCVRHGIPIHVDTSVTVGHKGAITYHAQFDAKQFAQTASAPC